MIGVVANCHQWKQIYMFIIIVIIGSWEKEDFPFIVINLNVIISSTTVTSSSYRCDWTKNLGFGKCSINRALSVTAPGVLLQWGGHHFIYNFFRHTFKKNEHSFLKMYFKVFVFQFHSLCTNLYLLQRWTQNTGPRWCSVWAKLSSS